MAVAMENACQRGPSRRNRRVASRQATGPAPPSTSTRPSRLPGRVSWATKNSGLRPRMSKMGCATATLQSPARCSASISPRCSRRPAAPRAAARRRAAIVMAAERSDPVLSSRIGLRPPMVQRAGSRGHRFAPDDLGVTGPQIDHLRKYTGDWCRILPADAERMARPREAGRVHAPQVRNNRHHQSAAIWRFLRNWFASTADGVEDGLGGRGPSEGRGGAGAVGIDECTDGRSIGVVAG